MTPEEYGVAGQLAMDELKWRGVNPYQPYEPEGEMASLPNADPSAVYPDRRDIYKSLLAMTPEYMGGLLEQVGPDFVMNLIREGKENNG